MRIFGVHLARKANSGDRKHDFLGENDLDSPGKIVEKMIILDTPKPFHGDISDIRIAKRSFEDAEVRELCEPRRGGH